jgi:hypothetical protein
MKKFVLSAALLFSALAGNAEGISSPSGMVKLDFELTKDGRPAYQVDYKGAPVINPSTLGLELKGATSLMDGFKVVRTSMKPGNRCGGRQKISATTTTNCW